MGLLPEGTVGLLFGRSSALIKGIRVIPGVIDEDTQGEIKIMVEATKGVTVIPQGARIAQLILTPKFKTNNPFLKEKRGTQGFGSTGPMACWVSTLDSRPTMTMFVENKAFKGILDTGADTSVISLQFWPKAWPLQNSGVNITGVGTVQAPLKSSRLLKWKDEEGHEGIFQPFVLPNVPVNLWGRDVLDAMGAVLTTQPVQRMMKNQGFCPGKGLGKNLQGDPVPVSDKPSAVRPSYNRAGLGHF